MMRALWSRIRLLLLSVLAICAPSLTQAICSANYHGLATINEVNRSGNSNRFIEVKLLSSSITAADYNSWTLRVCGNRGGCSGNISLGNNQVDKSGLPWIVIPVDVLTNSNWINLSEGTDVILRDGSGNTIDYLSVVDFRSQSDASCTPAFDWTHPGTNTHTIFRDPDGSGDWINVSGNSAGNTSGYDNNSGAVAGLGLSISDARAIQGRPLTFTLTLSGAHTSPVTVNYVTSDGTALAGTDYQTVSGVATIAAGQLSTSIQVNSFHTSNRTDTRFFVTLSGADHASLVSQVGIGTISPPNLTCFADNFNRTSLGNDWVTSHSNGRFGNPTMIDSRLRLTDDSENVATMANLQRRLPARNNLVEVEFDHFAYGNGGWFSPSAGADGIAVILSDASIAARPGGYGGSLGYAQKTDADGFAGGWLGIGLDEYGNYSQQSEGREGGRGATANAVAIRGSGSGKSGYRYLGGTGSLSPGVDSRRTVFATVNPGPNHRYRVRADSRNPGRLVLTVSRDSGDGFVNLVGPLDVLASPSQSALPTDFLLSFTGSTGSSTNFHELDNLQVCAQQLLPMTQPLHHFEISAAASASTCAPTQVTITAKDSSGNTLTNYTGTAQIGTTSHHGNWSKSSAQGTLAPAVDTDDNGVVSYSFAAADNGSIVLNLSNAHADSLQIWATDGGVSSSSGVVNFQDNSLVISENDSLNYDLIAGRTHQFKVEMWQKDPSSGNCQIATGYQGNFNLRAWLMRASGEPSGADDPGGAAPRMVAASTVTVPNDEPAGGNIQLAFANGVANFQWQASDVGRYRLKLKDNSSGFAKDTAGNPVTISSSDATAAWVVRPFALRVTAAGNPGAVDAAGAVYRKAGEDFTLNVAGVSYEAADDANGDGLPDSGADLNNNAAVASFGQEGESVAVSSELLLPGGGVDPGLSGKAVLTAFTHGQASDTYQFQEVGIIRARAQLSDGNYLESGRNLAAGLSGNIGRFIPADFSVVASTSAPGQHTATCTVGGANFSYLGEAFRYATAPEIIITPRTMSGLTTQNYNGNFRKLDHDDVTVLYPTKDNVTELPLTVSQGSGVMWETAGGLVTYALSLSDQLTYTKPLAPVAGFTSDIRPSVTAVRDSDNVTAPSLATAPVVLTPTGSPHYFGRWRLSNGYGPETYGLTLAFAAEYWDGDQFRVNTQDNCSPYAIPGGVTLTPQAPITNASFTSPGSFTLVGGLPPAGGEFRLGIPSPMEPGRVGVEWTVPGALQYDWNGDGVVDNPTATATFGQYRGHDRVIYWREVTR